MQEQPTGETPEQALARELQGAQTEIRGVGSVLDDALAEDDRLAALAANPPSSADTGLGNVAAGNGATADNGQAEGGWR
ncbi:hypothetical protein GCM10009554_57520 [Kribbella koreensis]|uniref:Uncharacterized protein n=1 Tax=Kribbella koreensis TaxID=57909 RepID=A0ABN1R8Z8_9ACTN